MGKNTPRDSRVLIRHTVLSLFLPELGVAEQQKRESSNTLSKLAALVCHGRIPEVALQFSWGHHLFDLSGELHLVFEIFLPTYMESSASVFFSVNGRVGR